MQCNAASTLQAAVKLFTQAGLVPLVEHALADPNASLQVQVRTLDCGIV